MEMFVFVTPGETFDAVELGEHTMALRGRLLELAGRGVESVHRGGVPAEVAPVDSFAIGSLRVTLAPAAVPAVVGLVRRWLAGRAVPSVRLMVGDEVLEVGGPSRGQRRRVEEFLRRHGG